MKIIIQNIRKDSNFDVTDRVDVVIYADGEDFEQIEASLKVNGEYLASQTLSRSVRLERIAGAPQSAVEVEWNEVPIRINVSR